MEKTRVEKHETFHDQDEALACQAQHPGAEITAEKGYPVMLYGKLMYPYPRPVPPGPSGGTRKFKPKCPPGRRQGMAALP